MTVLNNMLNEMAKALASESFVVPAYFAYGSDVITIGLSDSVLAGEFGDRVAATDSRTDATVTFSGIRVGASVASSTGEYLNSSGALSASTGGVLLSELLLPSLLHTTNYDIETDWAFTIQRRGQ